MYASSETTSGSVASVALDDGLETLRAGRPR